MLLDPAVYLVTDTGLCGGRDGVVATVRAAVAGGVSAVQLRDPDATTRELVELGEALLALLRPLGVPLVVNDRVDVALAIGADGAHVGQRDLDPVAARRLLGPDAHLGLSVSSVAETRAALALPAGTVDLLGAGPVRATPSKTDAAAPMGFAGLAAVCATVRAAGPAGEAGTLRRGALVPVVAIGGIGAADAEAVRVAGAQGLAVISAVCGAPDARAAARELAQAWRATGASSDARIGR